jgi:hypothetical protein
MMYWLLKQSSGYEATLACHLSPTIPFLVEYARMYWFVVTNEEVQRDTNVASHLSIHDRLSIDQTSTLQFLMNLASISQTR